MLVIKKVNYYNYIFCKELSSFIICSKSVFYNELPVSVCLFVYAVKNDNNIIGIDNQLIEYRYLYKFRIIPDELIAKLINYITDNNYIEKFEKFYKEVDSITRNTKLINK